MMFNKDNTNFNGESLCKSCKWGAPVYIGTGSDRHKATSTYLCVLETEERTNVGVCKYYETFKHV